MPGSAERMPFIVKTVGKQQSEVEVLGTHFDIAAYDDEKNIRTALIEGSVRVKQEATTRILKPGQKAFAQDGAINVVEVNTEFETGLKDGMIYSSGDREILFNEIARWYNVEVEYVGHVPALKNPQDGLTAILPRSESLENIMKILANQGIQVRLEKRKLIIKQ
jgi:hypothetical protein